jgi:hypothetical protein
MDEYVSVIVAAITGAIAGAVISFTATTDFYKHDKTACEANLPRVQECTFKWVPPSTVTP